MKTTQAYKSALTDFVFSNLEADQADDERRYWIGNVQLTAFWICSDEENAWSTYQKHEYLMENEIRGQPRSQRIFSL